MKKILLMLLCAASSLCAVETIETFDDAYIWGLGNLLHNLVDSCEKFSSEDLRTLGDLIFMYIEQLTPRQVVQAYRYEIKGKNALTRAKAKLYVENCKTLAKDLEEMIEFFEGMVALGAGELRFEEIRSNKQLLDQLDQLSKDVKEKHPDASKIEKKKKRSK